MNISEPVFEPTPTIIEALNTILKSLEPFIIALAIAGLSLAIGFVIWFAILLRKEIGNNDTTNN